jgi:hypothetical protein
MCCPSTTAASVIVTGTSTVTSSDAVDGSTSRTPFSDTFAFIARSDAPLSPAARAFVEIAERRLERVSEAALYAAGTSETVE